MNGPRHTRALPLFVALTVWAAARIACAASTLYAWGENVGWINFTPAAGPGVTVTTSAVTGFAWGENVGWINLSPSNGGVRNDGVGNLSGFAWGENIGWINFAPTGSGVHIEPGGRFVGLAWGENIGWINFNVPGTCDNCNALGDVCQPGTCCKNGSCTADTGGACSGLTICPGPPTPPPARPWITRGMQAGSTSITVTMNPNDPPICAIQVFGCIAGSCKQIGQGTASPTGSIEIALSAALQSPEVVYTVDACGGLSSAPQLIQSPGFSEAPVMSTRMVLLLASGLGLLGLMSLARVRRVR
jgi:hypothetical protein